jgi:hypothetical protein
MAWFKKKPDPISHRARVLTDEIAALETQIQELDTRLQRQQAQPRLRSTAVPQGATVVHAAVEPALSSPAPGASTPEEPVFEHVDLARLKTPAETPVKPQHFNELGVRKYDLPALLKRVRNHFRGPATTNPKLVSYLAAGGIQGLRPLRYERRVQRNRFIVFAGFLLLVLLGLALVFFHHR